MFYSCPLDLPPVCYVFNYHHNDNFLQSIYPFFCTQYIDKPKDTKVETWNESFLPENDINNTVSECNKVSACGPSSMWTIWCVLYFFPQRQPQNSLFIFVYKTYKDCIVPLVYLRVQSGCRHDWFCRDIEKKQRSC